MHATPAIDMRENRAPTSRSAPPSFRRASAITKHGMPPIQMAAPNWCSASTPSSSALSDSRAAACVVSVAAASSTAPAPSSQGAAAPRHSSSASTQAATALMIPATAKLALSTLPTGRSTVVTSTAVCSATFTASTPTSATALQAAMAAVRPTTGPSWAANGRTSSTRNSMPPSAMDWLTITRPCSRMPT